MPLDSIGDSSDSLEKTLDEAEETHNEIAKLIGTDAGVTKLSESDPRVQKMWPFDASLFRGSLSSAATYGDIRVYRGNAVTAKEVREEMQTKFFGAPEMNWLSSLEKNIDKNTKDNPVENQKQKDLFSIRKSQVLAIVRKHGFGPQQSA